MPDKENSVGAAKWKAIGAIIVAAIGVYGSVLATWMTSKTSDTGDALKATVEQINENVIPGIQRLVDDLKTENRILREENKDLNRSMSDLRERLARIETIVDPPSSSGLLKRLMRKAEKHVQPKVEDKPEEKKSIPQLQIEQLH